MNDFQDEINNFLSRCGILSFQIGDFYVGIEYKDDHLCTDRLDFKCDYDFSLDENLASLLEKLKEVFEKDAQKELKELEKERDEYELSGDYTFEFDKSLDECHEPFEIGMLSYCASTILKELDPIAYKEALYEYEMTLDRTVESDFCDILEQIEDKEDEIQQIINS